MNTLTLVLILVIICLSRLPLGWLVLAVNPQIEAYLGVRMFLRKNPKYRVIREKAVSSSLRTRPWPPEITERGNIKPWPPEISDDRNLADRPLM